MPATIREALPADSQQLITYIQRLCAEPDANIALSPGEFNLTVEAEQEILADYAAADNSIYLVAEIGDEIVGQLQCKGGTRQATRHAATLGMSVDRDWRHRGIGDQLLARAVQWARETLAVSRLELYVFARNETAIHLYTKHGFVIEGRRRRSIYRSGQYLDDLIMALLL